MAAIKRTVHALSIPLQQLTLLLPNACVTEVVPYVSPVSIPRSPNWILGVVTWRSLSIPLLLFERVVGMETPFELTSKSRIIVLNTHSRRDDLPYLAILSREIPHLHRISSGELGTVEESDSALQPYIIRKVKLKDESMVIPDVEALQQLWHSNRIEENT